MKDKKNEMGLSKTMRSISSHRGLSAALGLLLAAIMPVAVSFGAGLPRVALGNFTDRYRYAADFWLWSEFFKHSRCTGVEVPLAAFRFHGDQRSGEDRYRKEVVEIIEELQ